MELNKTLGDALQMVVNVCTAIAKEAGITLPTFTLMIGYTKGADARQRDKDSNTLLREVKTPVMVGLGSDKRGDGSAVYEDGKARIYINDRITLGSTEFYASVLHGVSMLANGRTTRANGSSTFYGAGFADKALDLGLAGDKHGINKYALSADKGERVKATAEANIKANMGAWPLLARSSEEDKGHKGGATATWEVILVDNKGVVRDTIGKVRLSAKATAKLSDPANKKYKVVLRQSEAKTEAPVAHEGEAA